MSTQVDKGKNIVYKYCSPDQVHRAGQRAQEQGVDPIYMAMVEAARGNVRLTAANVLATGSLNGLGLTLVRRAHLNRADELTVSSATLSKATGNLGGNADRSEAMYHQTEARRIEEIRRFS